MLKVSNRKNYKRRDKIKAIIFDMVSVIINIEPLHIRLESERSLNIKRYYERR